ncbi:MAG: uroporphyrinogen decarboxylase family protein [Anaerolineae bacterium]
MHTMTSIERFTNFMQRKPHDRIPVYEHFWGDTYKGWLDKGWIQENADFTRIFDYDLRMCWSFNTVADLNFKEVVLEETHDTRLVMDGNGAKLRRHKLHDSTPEHVDFTVKERSAWEEIRPLLVNVDERRINFEGYRKEKALAAQEQRYFCWSGVNVFEMMHPVCGHEYMLAGMALDPEWISDMCQVYADLTISLMEILFAREGYPDGIWFYEDMGFKGRPFMSPAMYREIIQPAHTRTIGFAHAKGMPVIMHSCGMVEKLVPGMLEAGVDCLQVIEVKAGMDLLKLYKEYGERLSFMGGIDVRELYSNDLHRVEAELLSKVPFVMPGNGYCLHSDHSIPNTVDFNVYRYFVDRGREIGTYR